MSTSTPKQIIKASAQIADTQASDPKNIFVIGDLLIDHTAFVLVADEHPPPIPGEGSFRVIRRLDTAGGAATTARAANVLGNTNVFLWGLVGRSPWGTFRSILEASQNIDGAERRIQFRGTQDDTDAAMTTISRLVKIRQTELGRETYTRHARFSDFGHIDIPLDRQLSELRYHLNHIHEEHPLDHVVLNDIEFGALHQQIIDEIDKFCDKHSVPLLLRARRNSSKYRSTKCSVLVCTLTEWCKLVGSNHNAEYWSTNLNKQDVANDFIRGSLASFCGTNSFVVLIGDDWIDSVICLEREGSGAQYRLSQLPGLPVAEKGLSQQIGVSDVLIGGLSVALTREAQDGVMLASAISFAMNAINSYQCSRWHHIQRGNTNSTTYLGKVKEITELPGGARFLPSANAIDLRQATTGVPGIYSASRETRETIDRLIREVTEGTLSIVLAASGGSGKTQLAKKLMETATRAGWKAVSYDTIKPPWDWSNPDKTINAIISNCRDTEELRLFVVVDEALKLKGAKTIQSNGVVLLNKAEEKKIRFLLIDADFLKSNQEKLRSQFARRVEWYTLPSPWQRPEDIPYVTAALIATGVADRSIRVSIEADTLVAILEWMLREHNTFGHLSELVKKRLLGWSNNPEIIFKWTDLPLHIRGKRRPDVQLATSVYTVVTEPTEPRSSP